MTPFVLLALTVLLAALALAVDLALLGEARVEMQNSADAAALAAVGSLVNDQAPGGDPAVLAPLLGQARASAVQYGQNNPVLGQPLALDPNPENLPDGDVVLGSVDTPQSRVFNPAADTGNPTNTSLSLVNAVRVMGRRTRARGDPVGLSLGGFLAFPYADVRAVATAMLDRDVIGFRPVFNQPLPLAPIALLSDPTATDPSSWEFQVTAPGGPHPMDAVLGTNALLLFIGVTDVTAASAQLAGGVTAAQLQDFGGQFVLGDQNLLPVPAAPALAPSDLAVVQAGLEQLQQSGALRIWPLFPAADAGNDPLPVSGFVAARVAQVESAADGSVHVTLQPGMLATPTAVTDASRRGVGGVNITNPYIVKVRLVE